MKRKVNKEDYLSESYERIENELEYIDIKPYSKTIIECRLRAIAEKFGKTTANKVIEDMGLEAYGWHKE